MSSMDYNKILVETLQCNNLGLSREEGTTEIKCM